MTPSDAPRRWYVAVAKPGRTVRALDEIVSLGICTVCPMERYHDRRKGRRYTIERPAYGTYILISTDDVDDLHHINRLFDIQTILRDERGFRTFPERLVDVVLEIDASGILDRTSRAYKELQPGQKIRISVGMFEGAIGELVKHRGHRRWEVLLSSVYGGGAGKMLASEDEIERVEKAA